MANHKKIHLLINTASRNGRQLFDQVLTTLKEHNLEPLKVHKLTKGDDLAVVCRRIKRAEPTLLIIAGGDGTISQSIHYFANSSIELALVPLGTTNNFARSLEIPMEIDAAVQIIARAKATAVDLGVVDGQHFANVLGVGLSAGIAKTVTPASKKRYGRLAYALSGLKQLSKPAFEVTVTDKDHELKMNFETRQLIVANGRYHAGKVIAQDATIDSRELVIFALGSRSRISFLKHMLDFYFGPRKRIIHGSYVIGTDFSVSSKPDQYVEIDGEMIGKTPKHISVAPRAIKIRCGL
jgi:YegS/Rv2252/BmrU family lipid kinase